MVVNPLLVFNTVLGLSVEDNSEIGGPFVGTSARSPIASWSIPRRHHHGAFDHQGRAAFTSAIQLNGIVTWLTGEEFNQRDELVDRFRTDPTWCACCHPPKKEVAA